MSEFLNVINSEYQILAKQDIIYPKFKIELIDQSEKNIIKEITEDIVLNTGSVSINYQQGVRRSCSFSIDNTTGEYTPSPVTGIFWIGTKFKLYYGLYDSDSSDIYWFCQGVFYVANPTNSHDYSSKIVNISGIDKFGYLGSDLGYNQLTGAYQFKADQKIYNIIKDVLMLETGNGGVIDPIPPTLDPLYKDEVLPYDLKKSSGDYLGNILVEIGNILGANIFYDRNGSLTVKSGTLDISYSSEAPIWNFSDKELEYMSSNLTYDFSNVVNIITVVGTNVNDKIYTYTAENRNPLSPTRIDYIGRKEIAPIETSIVHNDKSAKDYANFELNKRSIVQSGINFSCSFLPHLDVDFVCAITDEYLGFTEERFVIQSVDLPMSNEGMASVTASNLASLPYYELLEAN